MANCYESIFSSLQILQFLRNVVLYFCLTVSFELFHVSVGYDNYHMFMIHDFYSMSMFLIESSAFNMLSSSYLVIHLGSNPYFEFLL